MAELRNYQVRSTPAAGTYADIDQGLRAYMIKVYNLMGLGLLITGLAAVATIMMATTSTPTAYAIGDGTYLTAFGYAIFASPLK